MKKSLKVNAALNAIRQTLAIVFPLITFPYVSRVLGKAEYGRYSFSASIISYFILIATFGINNYAVREGARVREDKKRIQDLVSDLFTISLITTTFSIVFLVLLTSLNQKIAEYRSLVFIQGLSIILATVGVDWINTIYEDFFYITVRYIAIQIIALFAVYLFVRGPQDTAKYCFILVMGSYSGNLVNIFYIRKYVHLKVNYKVNLKKYFLPLLLLFVNSLATVIYVNSDITMLGFFTGDQEVGIYSFSSKIYNMIKYLINAVLVVTVPRLAFILGTNEKNYRKYLNSIFNALIILLVPCVAGLCMLSKSIILLLGGKQYLPGNNSLIILSFSLLFALIASVFSNCILIINRLEKRCLVGTITSAVVNVGLNFILIPTIGITGAAFTTVLAECINMIIQAFYSYKDLNIKLKLDKWICLVTIIEVIAIIVICHFSSLIFNSYDTVGALYRIVFSMICSILFYLVILAAFRKKIRSAVDTNLLKR